jgi:GTPase SAR1 family protein
VYDITKHSSFANVEKWIAELRQNGAENMTLMLVGNKLDLAKQREVGTESASQYAERE